MNKEQQTGVKILIYCSVSFLAGGWLFAPDPGFNIRHGGFNPFTSLILAGLCFLIIAAIHKSREDKELREETLRAARKINEKEG